MYVTPHQAKPPDAYVTKVIPAVDCTNVLLE